MIVVLWRTPFKEGFGGGSSECVYWLAKENNRTVKTFNLVPVPVIELFEQRTILRWSCSSNITGTGSKSKVVPVLSSPV